MKRLVWVLGALAVLCGVCALAVKAANDRETLVPPPDAVAEGFTREVLTKRWDRANVYLVKPVSDERLQQLQESLPDSSEVDAEIVARNDEHALVNVRVSSAAVAYSLVFEEEWKIVLE
jgi:hypothetical protein